MDASGNILDSGIALSLAWVLGLGFGFDLELLVNLSQRSVFLV